jgi:plastocyanin
MRSRTWGRVSLGAAVLVVLVLAISGCSGSKSSSTVGSGASSTASGALTVVEKNVQFTPSTLNAKVGDKVTFSNEDSVAHHVVVGTTDLGTQQPGQSVTWTADKAGVIAFKCVIHPSMTGQITVSSTGSASGNGY